MSLKKSDKSPQEFKDKAAVMLTEQGCRFAQTTKSLSVDLVFNFSADSQRTMISHGSNLRTVD